MLALDKNIKFIIFNKLDDTDIVILQLVCKNFYETCADKNFWMNRIKVKFEDLADTRNIINYRNTYIDYIRFIKFTYFSNWGGKEHNIDKKVIFNNECLKNSFLKDDIYECEKILSKISVLINPNCLFLFCFDNTDRALNILSIRDKRISITSRYGLECFLNNLDMEIFVHKCLNHSNTNKTIIVASLISDNDPNISQKSNKSYDLSIFKGYMSNKEIMEGINKASEYKHIDNINAFSYFLNLYKENGGDLNLIKSRNRFRNPHMSENWNKILYLAKTDFFDEL